MNGPRPDEAGAWLRRARSDLALAKAALRTDGVLPEDAAFHAQQCTEKALKAFLVHHGIAFPRTHSIELLLDLASNVAAVPKTVSDAGGLIAGAVA
jgi:HEPN domain-containing protein